MSHPHFYGHRPNHRPPNLSPVFHLCLPSVFYHSSSRALLKPRSDHVTSLLKPSNTPHLRVKRPQSLPPSTEPSGLAPRGLLFIYFWLHSVFVAVCRLSLAVESGGYSLDVVCGLLTAVASLVGEHGLSCSAACGIFPDQGLNSCPLHWQVQPLDHQGSPPNALLTAPTDPVLTAPATLVSLHL